MLGGSASFRAKQFVTEANKSTMVYEVKRVRAVWDPSLSIPGTDRRGGWRCPEGTRYGGQITDRFGRQCGWGLVRRIANMISNVGESLEDRDDRRRARRGGKRRVVSPETPELDTPNLDLNENDSALAESLGEVIPTPEPPKPRTVKPRRVTNVDTPEAVEPKPEPRPRRAPRRRPQGNLRPSEQRRMERELEQPGAPRTGLEEPSVEQVLTPEQASDAVPTEEFRPYVLRKYNEYARNVRKIREEGGDAGMLTRREWYAINKDNLRSAWKDVHGVDAPDSFEPPTPQPRRPRRRRQRAVEEAASTRSPSLRNDKEPVAVEPKPEPKMPSRPKKPSSVRPTGAQDKPRRPAPPTPPDWVSAGNGRWNVGNWLITASEDENGNFLRFVASTPDSRYAEGVSVDEVVMAMNSEDDLFNAPREVDWNNGLEAQGIFQISAYLNDQVIGKRVEILNDANNFPVAYGVAGDADFADFQMNVENNIQQARQTRQAIEKLIRDGNIRKQDFWLDRNDVARDMESVLDWLEEVEDAWLYVQSTNAEVNTPEIDLGSGWNKVGENKWYKNGIELELGFVNGEVVSGRIANREIGAIYEQEFNADQSQVKDFVDNLYQLAGGEELPKVVQPKDVKKSRLRKKGKLITGEKLRQLQASYDLNVFKVEPIHEGVHGIGFQKAPLQLEEVNRMMRMRFDEGYEILQNVMDSISVTAQELSDALEGVIRAAERHGLSDNDYFQVYDGETISIKEIKQNIVSAKQKLKERYEFARQVYWDTAARQDLLFDRDRLRNFNRGRMVGDNQTQREMWVKFLAMNNFEDWEKLINLDRNDPRTSDQKNYFDFLDAQMAKEPYERNYKDIAIAIRQLMRKREEMAQSGNLEEQEIVGLLGLPDGFELDSIGTIDEALQIADSALERIQYNMQMNADALSNYDGLNNDAKAKLIESLIKDESEKYFYQKIQKRLNDKKRPLEQARQMEQMSLDRDQAIARYEVADDFDTNDINQLVTLAEETNFIIRTARSEQGNDFRQPAALVGDAVREVNGAFRGKTETEQLEIINSNFDERYVDVQIKILNDAIEKFRLNPTRATIKELRDQAAKTIQIKAAQDAYRKQRDFINAPHRLDLAQIENFVDYIYGAETAYGQVADYLNLIFKNDFGRYDERLITPSQIQDLIFQRRALLRQEFERIPNSPLGIVRIQEMLDETRRKTQPLLAEFNQHIENLRLAAGKDGGGDRDKIEQIAILLAQASSDQAVNALEIEELKRELHSKQTRMRDREIPQNPIHVLFGGKPEDHEGGINLENIAERINSVSGDISDRKIRKYISDLDDAYRKLSQFDDNETIRFAQGDVNVGDAKKAIVEASMIYQRIRNSRENNPNEAIFTPRISNLAEVHESQLEINPVSQDVTAIPETDKALINDAINALQSDEKRNELILRLDNHKVNGDVEKAKAMSDFASRLRDFVDNLTTNRENMTASQWDEVLLQVDEWIKSDGGVRVNDVDNLVAEIDALKVRKNQKLQEIKELGNKGLDSYEYDRQVVDLTNGYLSFEKQLSAAEQKLNLYNWALNEVPKIVERKARNLGVSGGDITKPLDDSEIAELSNKVNAQIKKAIAKRLDTLQQYLNENYDPNTRPWDITPDQWNNLSAQDKVAYIKQAYSHKLIRGNNGRNYTARADVTQDYNNRFQITVNFFEVDEDGNAIRDAGYAERTVNVTDGYVYNARMFLGENNPIDKGAGIQTVFNQHAFMFLNSIGVDRAKVTTAADGPYVWARIGFVDDDPIDGYKVDNIRNAMALYRSVGGVGLIRNDGEYRRLEALVRLYDQDDETVTHQDFIFAFDDSRDRFGQLRIKEFFRNRFELGAGYFHFRQNDVTRNPGERAQELLARLG
jgi:hypothetical protein